MVFDFLKIIQNAIPTNVIAMEYPGYGIYEGSPNSVSISEDSLVVYDFIRTQYDVPNDKIIIFGRSIGSGPASFLAARRGPRALILMSAYTSLRNVVKTHVGSFLQYIVAERFSNIDEIEKVNCPIFLIHGKRDVLIPYNNSKALYEKAKDRADYWFPNFMTHNSFDLMSDLVVPIIEFFVKNSIKVESSLEHITSFQREENKDELFMQNKKTFFERIFKKD